jgi:peptidoglycan/xylan/chitin deacetylase (PgdA/CDA1 family)
MIMLSFGIFISASKSRFHYNDANIYYVGNMDARRITVSISVFSGANYLEKMLDILNRFGVKTTFFITGSIATKYPDQILKIHEGGHEIGNHGYSKTSAQVTDKAAFAGELSTTESILFNLCKVRTEMYAPPIGSPSQTVASLCKDIGYKIIMSSRDIGDLTVINESILFERATLNIRNGDVILVHPTISTIKVLPKILEHFSNENYDIVTISKILEPHVY